MVRVCMTTAGSAWWDIRRSRLTMEEMALKIWAVRPLKSPVLCDCHTDTKSKHGEHWVIPTRRSLFLRYARNQLSRAGPESEFYVKHNAVINDKEGVPWHAIWTVSQVICARAMLDRLVL